MIVSHSFQDILDLLQKTPTLTLPTIKNNGLKIEVRKDDCHETVYSGQEPPLPFANSEVFNANISRWRRLSAVDDGCKAVYEVTLDVTNNNFTFKAGDTIGIVPHNDESDVNFIINHLNLISEADVPYMLSLDINQKGCKIPPHVPVKSTLRHVLTHCVDLRSVLKKLFLLALSRHTKDESEKKILEYLCSKEGSAAYTMHILNNNLCALDIFKIFKSCKPPIEVLLANMPRLLPRPYSIVNTGMKDPKTIKVCFSVMDLGNNRKGLTTGWLETKVLNRDFDLESGIEKLSLTNECDIGVPMYLRKNISGFCLPDNLDSPLVLISPGTGVAPFIGFLEEIELAKQNNPKKKIGEVHLFFGCRNPKLDFIYEAELNGFLTRGVLNKLYTAFSRIEDSETKYIQDALLKEGENITELIRNGASIFICGDLNKMAVEVKETLMNCLVKYGNLTNEEALRTICDMQKQKKYFVDAWS